MRYFLESTFVNDHIPTMTARVMMKGRTESRTKQSLTIVVADLLFCLKQLVWDAEVRR